MGQTLGSDCQCCVARQVACNWPEGLRSVPLGELVRRPGADAPVLGGGSPNEEAIGGEQKLPPAVIKAGIEMPRLQLGQRGPSTNMGMQGFAAPKHMSLLSPRKGSKISSCTSTPRSVKSLDNFRCTLQGAWVVLVLCSPQEDIPGLLGLRHGEAVICSIVGGGASKVSGNLDGCVAAVEFAIASERVTDVVVMQPANAEPVRDAILEAEACKAAGHAMLEEDPLPLPSGLRDAANQVVEEAARLREARRGVKAGLAEMTKAVGERLVEATIDRLLEGSQLLRTAVRNGKINLQGAMLEVQAQQAIVLEPTRRQEKIVATFDIPAPPPTRHSPRNDALHYHYDTMQRGGCRSTQLPKAMHGWGSGQQGVVASTSSGRKMMSPKKAAVNAPPSSLGYVPAEEALAVMMRGSRRSAARFKKHGRYTGASAVASRNATGLPDTRSMAVVFHSVREKTPPVELIFDSPPGGLLSLAMHKAIPGDVGATPECIDEDDNVPSVAGDSNVSTEALINSAEYSINFHKTMLLLVLGHDHGGAGLMRSEKKRTEEVRLGIQETMRQLLRASKIGSLVADGEVQVQGAIFRSDKFEVQWIGQHPEQEALIEHYKKRQSLRLHPTKTLSSRRPPMTDRCKAALRRLEDCNRAAVQASRTSSLASTVDSQQSTVGGPPDPEAEEIVQPTAVILANALPPARGVAEVMTSRPGEFHVQRTCGSVCGRRGDDVQTSLEYITASSGAPVLLVLGDVRCPALSLAVRQAQEPSRTVASRTALGAQAVLNQLAPAVQRARQQREYTDIQVRQTETPALEEAVECQLQLLRIVAGESVRYTQERLLLDSDFIADRLREGSLELQGAYVEDSGEIHFLGRHPAEAELLRRQQLRTSRKPSK
eukprot:TRINITY_DN16335_c0_g1_i1.p1 TRINITY_DN16335_c0_g1~~TRINITY_DN16335_c0_g1_i1.p1  ORF type:complete len:882 (+),score=230.21 TRINITY_DN16335_c0_g1_i1:88-2733(+)